MRLHRLAPVLCLFLLAPTGCEAILPPPPEELDLWKDAGTGVTDETLGRVCTEYWEALLRNDPFRATMLGDPRYNGKVPYGSRNARAEQKKELQRLRHKAASVAESELNADDRLTRELLLQDLDKQIAHLELRLEEWNIDPLEGPQLQILALADVQPHATSRERKQLVERWERFPSYIRQSGVNLSYGGGRVASRTPMIKVIAQCEEILAVDPMDSPLVTVATGGGRWVELAPDGNVAELAHRELGDARLQRELRKINRHLQDGERLVLGTRVLIPAAGDPLTAEERGLFLYDVLTAVEDGIYPALAGYKDLLKSRLSGARSDEEPGLMYVSGGQAAYRTLIREHTSLPVDECDPQAIHDFGLVEVARIRAEISELGEKVFGTTDVAVIQEKLRSAPDLHFATRDEVEGKATEAMYRAQARMSEYFGLLPEAACEVVRISPYEEKDTTIAYYRQPAADGSRPGRYFINTYAPETRPRYEAEVLAYHEAIPGHHLQLAIAQELEGLPLFRRFGGSTAYVEGWALYTERLCDEMGLYSGDLDRFGVLSFDAWRASRLVVDTGLHAFGWSRQKAIDYLYENTLLAKNNVVNEVDRYIAWPGQALAYKIGQREILSLRDRAQAELGPDFSYPEFHDRVLENGAVSLETLRSVVGSWIDDGPDAK
jgi:uncharacterized protein (DUF885 family)